MNFFSKISCFKFWKSYVLFFFLWPALWIKSSLLSLFSICTIFFNSCVASSFRYVFENNKAIDFLSKNFFWLCLKIGLLPSEKNFLICFNDRPWKMMKNAFYFILKALLVLKVFKFLSWIFGHLEKTAWLEISFGIS